MKIPAFSKIILSLLVLFLFLLLWMNQWRHEQSGTFKINRFTGKVYQLQNDGEWKPLKQVAREREEEKIRLAREKKEAEELHKRLESFTNMSEEEKKKSIDNLLEEFLKEKGLLNKDGSINKEAVKKLEGRKK